MDEEHLISIDEGINRFFEKGGSDITLSNVSVVDVIVDDIFADEDDMTGASKEEVKIVVREVLQSGAVVADIALNHGFLDRQRQKDEN
jgi:hypothetical protein